MKYEKSFYQVFECRTQGMFDYDESKVLFEHDNLAFAHTYAYEQWVKSNKTKVFTIIQPHDGSCRGGYGFPEEE